MIHISGCIFRSNLQSQFCLVTFEFLTHSMSNKIIKPRKGQWIVKLQKLQECQDCHEFFTDSLSLKEHLKVHIKNDKLNNDEVFKEIIKDDGSKEFQCVKCNSVYEKKKSLQKHFHAIHREKKFKCEKCRKMFPIKSELRKHFKACNGIRFQTNIKNDKMTDNEMLKEIIKDDGSKEFQCIKCDNVYGKKDSVRKHF